MFFFFFFSLVFIFFFFFFFFQAEDGIRDGHVTGVQTCALPICGLGLASVYGIVRQSNGFITVESEPGAGSVFAMHFPAVVPVDAGTADRTILLVEDEKAVRAIVSDMLTRQGYEVL